MANLKSNGTEVTRFVRRRERNDLPVLRDTTELSLRSNGWVLRKHTTCFVDVYSPNGYRLHTAGWKRWQKIEWKSRDAFAHFFLEDAWGELQGTWLAAGFEKVS